MENLLGKLGLDGTFCLFMEIDLNVVNTSKCINEWMRMNFFHN